MSMPKVPYQVAWSELHTSDDCIRFFDCEASDLFAAVRLARVYFRDVLGLSQSDYLIREIYCI